MSSGEGPAGFAPSADRPERGEATQSNGIQGGLGWLLGQGFSVLPIYSVTGGVCHCFRGTRCEAPGKHPMTRNGLKDASSDPSVVREWWLAWPDASWAVKTGGPSAPTIIDVDRRNGGLESIERFELEERGEPLPPTLTVASGGGGRHLWFAPSKIRSRTNWRPGIDVKGVGGYVLLPGSAHVSGGTYRWLNFEEWAREPLPELPDDVQSLLRGQGGSSYQTGGSSVTDGLPPTTVLKERGLRAGARNTGFWLLACRVARTHYPHRDVSLSELRAVWAKTDQPSTDAFEWRVVEDEFERAWAWVEQKIQIERAWERGLRRRAR